MTHETYRPRAESTADQLNERLRIIDDAYAMFLEQARKDGLSAEAAEQRMITAWNDRTLVRIVPQETWRQQALVSILYGVVPPGFFQHAEPGDPAITIPSSEDSRGYVRMDISHDTPLPTDPTANFYTEDLFFNYKTLGENPAEHAEKVRRLDEALARQAIIIENPIGI